MHEEPLMAFSDASHAAQLQDVGSPGAIKSWRRAGCACEALQATEWAVKMYKNALPPDCAKLLAKSREMPAELPEALRECAALYLRALGDLDKQTGGAGPPARALLDGFCRVESNGGPAPAPGAIAAARPAMAASVGGFCLLPAACRSGPGGPRSFDAMKQAEQYSGFLSRDTGIAMKPLRRGGVGLFACRDMAPATLLMLDMPQLVASMDTRRCHNCLLPLPPKPVLCGGAPACDRKYCSPQCRAQADATFHAPQLCGVRPGLALLEAEIDGISSSSRFPLLMWKALGWAMVHQAASASRGRLACAPADAPPLCFLARRTDYEAGHAPPAVRYPSLVLLRTWDMLHRALGGPRGLAGDPFLSMRWVVDMTAMVMVNPMALEAASFGDDGSMLLRGAALMIQGTLFNHACKANSTYHSDMDKSGRVIIFMTTKAVKRGEELTIEYVDSSAHSREMRRCKLSQQYGFDCDCSTCARGE